MIANQIVDTIIISDVFMIKYLGLTYMNMRVYYLFGGKCLKIENIICCKEHRLQQM